MLGCDKKIKLGLSDGEGVGTPIRDADIIKLSGNEGSELGASDGSFDSSSDGDLEGSLFGESLES